MDIYNPHCHHRMVPILCVAAGIPVALTCLLLLVVNAGWHDEAMPNDAALRLSSITVDDTDNAYTDLHSASTALASIDATATEPRRDPVVEGFVNGGSWNAAQAAQAITTYRPVIDAFRVAATKSIYQDPTMADPATININSGLADISEARFIAYQTALEAIAKARSNDVDGGLAEAVTVVRVGYLMQTGQNSLITYLVGSAVEQIGLTALRTIAQAVNLTAAQSIRVATELDQYRDSVAGLVAALKMEYAVGRSYQGQLAHLDGLYNVFNLYFDANGQLLPEAPGTWFARLLDRSGIMKFYYMPNQTWRWRIEETQARLALAETSCATMTNVDTRTTYAPGFRLSYFWTPNVIGKIVHDIGQISYGGLTTKRCHVALAVSATQALLGMSAYRTDMKGLPTILDQLAPRYLSTVPIDPYSDQPLHYTTTTGTVYSVGPKHTDLGGSPVSSDWQALENPSFTLAPVR